MHQTADMFLIDLANAVTFTGRPPGTIHRWVSEGRITRHGTGKRALYDFRELPAKGSGQDAPPRINLLAAGLALWLLAELIPALGA